jgi:hypothetical protein
MKKTPKAKHFPEQEKTPRRAGFNEDPFKLLPAWRIGRMEMCDPFGWHEVDGSIWPRILERMKSFETMTLHEMIGNKNHLIPVDRLCADAQTRLEALHLDDVESLFSLRLTKVERIWGFLEHNVVILLWWDPEHKVCPMNITDN